MIHALAECGVGLRAGRCAGRQDAAGNFILENMSQPDGKLFRSFKDGAPASTPIWRITPLRARTDRALRGHLRAALVGRGQPVDAADVRPVWRRRPGRLLPDRPRPRGSWWCDARISSTTPSPAATRLLPRRCCAWPRCPATTTIARQRHDHADDAGLLARQSTGFGRMLMCLDCASGAEPGDRHRGRPGSRRDAGAAEERARALSAAHVVAGAEASDEEILCPWC